MENCRERLAYIAPGITVKIVAAMREAMQRSQPAALTVIIDADPEVCCLGSGTVDGLKARRRDDRESNVDRVVDVLL
jgi:hypothetical protein